MYFAFYVVGDILNWVIHGTVPETAPVWVQFIETLPPHEALGNIVTAVWVREISTGEPLLLQEWTSVIVFLLWLVVPILVGQYRFKKSNII